MLSASPLLSVARLERVTCDFGIVPQFLTVNEAADIADGVSHSGSFPANPIVVGRGAQSIALRGAILARHAYGSNGVIGFAEFVEFLALCAVHALSKPKHDAQYRTTPIKVAVLLDIWGAGDTRSLELLMLRGEEAKAIDQSTVVHETKSVVETEEEEEEEDETKINFSTAATALPAATATAVQTTASSRQPRKKGNLFAC